MEPPVSEPSASGAHARRRPRPRSRRDEPPGTRVESHGLRVGLKAEFSVDEPIANSSMLVLPTTIAPAASSRSTTVAREGRAVALEHPRAAGRGHALDVEQVLDRHRDAGQRARRPARPRSRRRRRARAPSPAPRSRGGRRPASAPAARCGRGARARPPPRRPRARAPAARFRPRSAARPRSSAEDPGDAEEAGLGVRRLGRAPSRGPGWAAARPRGGGRLPRGMAHRLDARGIEGLDRLRVGEDVSSWRAKVARSSAVSESCARRATCSTVSGVTLVMGSRVL